MTLLLLAGAALGAPEGYDAARASLDAQRRALSSRSRTAALRSEVRETLLRAVREEVIGAWLGTPWAFYGTSETPGSGAIACGYFVSTVLRDAGLRVERVPMAQQLSEHIVQSFAEPAHVRRFRSGDVGVVVDAVLAEPEGLYVVGLDFHVGLLVRRADGVEFCHSSWIDAVGVLCEDPRTSAAFASGYHVYGPVLEDRVIDAWLDGAAIRTVTAAP